MGTSLSFILVQEFGCLQDNMDVLLDDCRDAIKEFTADQDEDLDLDTILMKACTPMIKQFCGVCTLCLFVIKFN